MEDPDREQLLSNSRLPAFDEDYDDDRASNGSASSGPGYLEQIEKLDWDAVNGCGPKAAKLEEEATAKVQELYNLHLAAQTSLNDQDAPQPSKAVLAWKAHTAAITPEECAFVLSVLSAYTSFNSRDEDDSDDSTCRHPLTYLQCLSVKVPHKTAKELFQRNNREFFFSRRLPESCYVAVVHEDFVPRHEEEVEGAQWPSHADGPKGCQRFLPRWGKGVLLASFEYSGAWRLFDFSNLESQVFLTEVLMNAPPSSRVFSSPVARALNHQAWHSCYTSFLRDRFLDLFMLGLLVPFSFYYRRGFHVAALLCIVLSCLSLREVSNFVLDLICFGCIYKRVSKVLTIVLVSWNGVCLLLNLYTAICLFAVFWERNQPIHAHLSESLTYRHPSLMSFMVLARWMSAYMGVLSFRTFGEHVLPVFHAITQPASLYFALYLMLVFVGSFHAYYIYPISDNIAENHAFHEVFSTNWFAFLKIFRLEALGDFDLWELEGQNEQVLGSLRNGSLEAEIEDPVADERVRSGFLFLFFCLTISVTVVLMNVYVGLLGTLYDDALRRKKLLHCQWRSHKILEILAKRYFYHMVTRCSVPEAADDGVWIVHSEGILENDGND